MNCLNQAFDRAVNHDAFTDETSSPRNQCARTGRLFLHGCSARYFVNLFDALRCASTHRALPQEDRQGPDRLIGQREPSIGNIGGSIVAGKCGGMPRYVLCRVPSRGLCQHEAFGAFGGLPA